MNRNQKLLFWLWCGFTTSSCVVIGFFSYAFMWLDYDEMHCNTGGDCSPIERDIIISDIVLRTGSAVCYLIPILHAVFWFHKEVFDILKARRFWLLTTLHCSLLLTAPTLAAIQYYSKWLPLFA